jgi:sugar lactone lactonase YvrE
LTFPPQSKPASPHQIAPHRARRCGPRSLALVALLALVAALAATPGQAIASKQAVDFFGGNGTAGGQFGSAAGVAVNDSGTGPANAGDIYALDAANNRIERFGRDDGGTPGNTPADTADDTYFFISAWGADVDSSSSGGSDYEICTVAANCQAAVASPGNGTAAGNGALAPTRASGLALDQDTGNLYLTDAENNRVNVYAGDGTFLRSFGYDVVASGPDNAGTGYEVCVAAAGDVCKGGVSGTGAGQVGAAPLGPGHSPYRAGGIAVSTPDSNPATGTVFLADSANNRVNTYNLDGAGPGSIGSAAVFHSSFDAYPTQLAVDSRGILYADDKISGGVGGGPGDDDRILRYDSQNADGGGVGFLAPLLAPYNENQRLTFVNASGGQFRLSFGGDTTPDLPYNAGAPAIQAALEALPSIGAGNVLVNFCGCGGENPYDTVSFTGSLATTNVGPLSVSNGTTPLTGTITASTIADGHGGALARGTGPLALDPDTDGAGPDTDVLYAERGQLIQQFGPANPAGLTAAPTSVDEIHGTSGASGLASGLAVEPSTGRFYAASSGTAGNGVYVLDTTGPPPTASMDSVDAITSNSADLHATIDPNGPPATRYHFDYVDDATYQATGFTKARSTPEEFLGVQEDPQAVTEHLQPGLLGLEPNTEYHVRVVAGRKFATPVISNELEFTTAATSPLAETAGAPVRTTTTAQLNGRVTPLGTATSFHFEYGTDTSYGQQTPPISVGAGQLTRFAAAEVSGLTPDTTYHYRIVADNGVGSPVAGDDMTVHTRASDELPGQSDEFPGPPGSDRAWEQVSVADPSGNPISAFSPQAFSDDGNRALYGIAGGTSSSSTGAVRTHHYAERTPDGWQERSILPSRDQLAGVDWVGAYGPSDLSTVLTTNYEQFDSAGKSQIWRFNPGSSPSLLLELPSGRLSSPELGVSADTSRVLAFVRGGALDPAHPDASDINIYDVGSPLPQLVSLLPGNQVSPCGAPESPGIGFRPSRWLSDDGFLAFFESRPAPPSAGPAPTPQQVYLRDLGADQTELVSGPPLSGPDCGASFVQATPTVAFIATASRLDPADVEPTNCGASNDVYRYGLDDHSLHCVTCVLPGFSVDVVGSDPNQIAVADDGARLYFTTFKRLLPGAPPDGQRAIYRVDVDSGELAYVAPPDAEGIGSADPKVVFTPDGSTLVFASSLAALNPAGGVSDNGATRQFYRYDDFDRSLVCVSCPQDGSPPLGPESSDLKVLVAQAKGLNNSVSLSADGKTLAFGTPTPLVAEDQNTGPGNDLLSGDDVYEWRDGRLLLVTDGQTSAISQVGVGVDGITPSGDSIFFTAAAALTPDAPDALPRLYSARIGGGFDFPVPLPPCDLNSGACEGAGTSPGDQPGAGSAVFSGPGNPPPIFPKPCPKGKVRRHGRCVAKKAHKKHNRHLHNHRRARR